MQKISIDEAIEQILTTDPRYHKDAYQFVRSGLDYTIKQQKKNPKDAEQHVSGQELLAGIRDFALHEFGPLTHTVLNYWNVRKCEDFGEIVFNMVTIGILRKTEKDSREDFKNGYDFKEAFLRPFEPTAQTKTVAPKAEQPKQQKLH